MTVTTITTLPFDGSYLGTWVDPNASDDASASDPTTSNPNLVDTIHLSPIQQGGEFTTGVGDSYHLADLFKIQEAASGAAITSVDIGLRGAGTLTLDGVDVTTQLSFSRDQFNRVIFNAGTSIGDSTDIVVAASPTRGSSPALEISAEVTGTRSINAAPALYQQDGFTFVAQRASLLAGYDPKSDPGLNSVGNFTSQAGDGYRLADLFKITQAQTGSIHEVD